MTAPPATPQPNQIAADGSGIWLVDKPVGITSHDVVDQVRRLTGQRRVGHTGTLDPLASGLLIVLVGRDFTKLQPLFLKQDKTYECTFRLGVETDTYDSLGQIVKQADSREVAKISEDEVEKALQKFRGPIWQQVPAYSAVKVKGKKMYDLARRQVEMPALPQRQVVIHELSLLDFQPVAGTGSLRIICSSGTYIRSLVHDLGQVLGVGAIVTALRRIASGSLSVAEALTLEAWRVKFG